MPDLRPYLLGLNEGFTLPLKNLQGAGVLSFGNIWFVNSVTGADGQAGNTPGSAKATLNGMITGTNPAPTAGDVIFVMPGHAETLTTAAAVNVNIAGLTIVGLGNGRNRPTFTFSTAVAASFDINSANTTLQNLVFLNNIDNQTAMVNVKANDTSIFDCFFQTNTGTTGAAVGVLSGTAGARLRIERNLFIGPATNSGTTTTAQIDHEIGIDYVIANNYFQAKCTQNITNGATILGGFIHNNVFVTGTGTKGINMAAASTPMITNNRFNVPSGTAPIVAAAGFVAGNVYSAAAGVTAGTASTF